MEHASIASFARFSLQLLSVGAPPELLHACHQAALDEIEHARMSFDLASRFGAEAIGPGPLDLTGVLGQNSFDEILIGAFREGCVGETVAALVAQAQLAHATDPEVRRCLERIAEDEARHAELAWRFVAWALMQRAPEQRDALVRRLESVAAMVPDDAAPDDVKTPASSWRGHGRLLPRDFREVSAAALVDVVRPALRQLARAASS
jgi:hypothetical protein